MRMRTAGSCLPRGILPATYSPQTTRPKPEPQTINHKRYRAQWRHRVRYWQKRLKKYNKKGKAYRRVKRRKAAASAAQKFRQTWKTWYYSMYYSYRSRVGSSRFKKYYPKVADLNKEIGKYFTDKKDYYKGRMKKYNVRSRGYRVYFRYGRTHDGLLNCNM